MAEFAFQITVLEYDLMILVYKQIFWIPVFKCIFQIFKK